METSICVRDNDWTIMHLPFYYTKIKLYERFFFINGWEIKSASDDSYPPVTKFKERMIMNLMVMRGYHYG